MSTDSIGKNGIGGNSDANAVESDNAKGASKKSKKNKRKGKKSKKGKKLAIIIVSMVVVCLAIVAGVVGYAYNNTYYVGVNDKNELFIYKGFKDSWFTPLNGRPDSVVCESAIYDTDAVPADCQHLTLDSFTQALRTELVSDKIFHSQEDARNYLTRAIASGLLPVCPPKSPIIYDATGQPVPPQDHPVPCRKAK